MAEKVSVKCGVEDCTYRDEEGSCSASEITIADFNECETYEEKPDED